MFIPVARVEFWFMVLVMQVNSWHQSFNTLMNIVQLGLLMTLKSCKAIILAG